MDASRILHVVDINGDKRPDVLTTSAHDYGVFWLEQDAERKRTRRVIDDAWSQGHASTTATAISSLSWSVGFELAFVLAVCGFVFWLGLFVATCGDTTDIFVARIVLPVTARLRSLAQLNQICNDANVVFDDVPRLTYVSLV